MGFIINNFKTYGFIEGAKQTFSDIKSSFSAKTAKVNLKIAMAPHPKLDGMRQALAGGKLSHVNGKDLPQTTSIPSSVPQFIRTKFEQTVRSLNDKVKFQTQSLRDKNDWDSDLITTTTKENAEKFSARDIKRLANAARWLPQGSSKSNHAKEMVHAALDLISVKIQKGEDLSTSDLKKLAAAAKLFPGEVAKAIADAPDSLNDLKKLLPKEKPFTTEVSENNNQIPEPAQGNLSEFHQKESSTMQNIPTEPSQPQRPAQEGSISTPWKKPAMSPLDSGVRVTVKDLAGIIENLADIMPGTDPSSIIKNVADVNAKAAKELKKLLKESQKKSSGFSKILNFFSKKTKS